MSDTAESQSRPVQTETAYQPAFTAGELAPRAAVPLDLEKEHSGAALMRNFYVQVARATCPRRPGTQWGGRVAARRTLSYWLIPFKFSITQQYVIVAAAGRSASSTRARSW